MTVQKYTFTTMNCWSFFFFAPVVPHTKVINFVVKFVQLVNDITAEKGWGKANKNVTTQSNREKEYKIMCLRAF